MRLVLTGRNVDISPALRKLVNRRVAKLDRMFGEALVSAQIVLTQEKYRRIAELVVHTRGDHMLHGAGDRASWEQSLGAAIEKVIRQGETVKGKWQERNRRTKRVNAGAPVPAAGDGRRPAPAAARLRVVRAKGYAGKPMTIDEAAREAAAARDGVVVFRNATTNAISVLYRRRDGDFALIEPEP
jgi:ribosome hibernation promoting factor